MAKNVAKEWAGFYQVRVRPVSDELYGRELVCY